MSNLQQLERALINADAAGDVEAARTLAAEVRRMRAAAPAKSPGITDKVVDGAVDVAKGVASGFADLGDTLLNAAAYLPGKAIPAIKEWNDDRSASLKQFNDANKDSTAFAVGRVGGNIAATWPVGGVLGAGVKAVSAAPRVQALGNAIASGGFNLGAPAAATVAGKAADVGIRALGGAISGGAGTALVSPEDVVTGAVAGAALPVVVKGLGAAGKGASQGIKAIRSPADAKLAKTVLEAAEAKTPEEIAAVRAALNQQGPSLLPPEAALTVPQILQQPGVSQLQRTVKNAGDTTLFRREQAQNVARLQALDGISPVTGTVQQSAQNMGNALERVVMPAEKAESGRIKALYEAVDPADESAFVMPVERLRAAQDRYLGPGTFGTGKRAADAVREAENIVRSRGGRPEQVVDSPILGADSKPVRQIVSPAVEAGGAPFREIQNLRSSLNEAILDAEANQATKEAAALKTMLGEIDSGIDAVAAGRGSPLEVFTPAMVSKWREANAAHAAKMDRFHTGPQVSMFRKGGDGLPAAQGAELAGKFFNGARSQTADAQAYKKLIDNNPDLIEAIKNYAITDLANQTDRLGTLSNGKVKNWLDGRSGAIGELFGDQEQAVLRAVSENLNAADLAENLGRASGSNTAQNALSVLRSGILDNQGLATAVGKVPFVGGALGTGLSAWRDAARKSKAEALGGLLADPVAMENALAKYLATQAPASPTAIGNQFSELLPFISRAVPALSSGR